MKDRCRADKATAASAKACPGQRMPGDYRNPDSMYSLKLNAQDMDARFLTGMTGLWIKLKQLANQVFF
jgi:hypothetical protein